MLESLRRFFAETLSPGLAAPGGSDHALRVATAALLLEMMRSDGEVSPAERAAVTTLLRERFGLADEELASLVAIADEEAREAPGEQGFTRLINTACDAAAKVRIVECLWQVAWADGRVDAHEQHFLRRIADLLYVSRGDYVAAKQRARVAMGIGEP